MKDNLILGVLILGLICSSVLFFKSCYKITTEIETKGLKNIVGEIWEGKK